MRTCNQLHPPRPKSGREVELNKKCSIVKKDGTSTSLVGIGTQPACKLFVHSMRDNAKKLGITLKGNYIILAHEIK